MRQKQKPMTSLQRDKSSGTNGMQFVLLEAWNKN